MKKSLILFLFGLTTILPAFSLELKDITEPKAEFYRVGTSNEIEKEYKVKNTINTKNVKQSGIDSFTSGVTYADLSIKKISQEISTMVDIDNPDMMADLSLLWQGAATKSDTIKYAIYKLSNPDADKPDEKSIKKVLTTLASMSTLVGASTGNPLLSTGSFFTGSILNIMGQDTKALNYKYTRVNDADMIILIRKIVDLQQLIVNRYCDYITAKEVLNLTTKMVQHRYKNFKIAENGNKEQTIISDAYYRDALDQQMKARNDFYAKRASLEQIVGADIFLQFEKELNNREK